LAAPAAASSDHNFFSEEHAPVLPARRAARSIRAMVLYPRVGTHRPRRTSAHVSRKVRALIWIREFLKAPDIPPKMLARERNLTKYSHGDIVDDIGLAETVLTILKLRTTRTAGKWPPICNGFC
jgi:hypothetical protein